LAPILVDVEHLSAETYVERSHGLPSPGRRDGEPPSTTWFFYPGFTAATGGLLREPGLIERRREFGRGDDWLASLGIVPALKNVASACSATATMPSPSSWPASQRNRPCFCWRPAPPPIRSSPASARRSRGAGCARCRCHA
jgi:hypothetical protein